MSTPLKFLHIDEMNTFDDLWNHPLYQSFRTTVNDSEAMPASCKTCYQSSVANWNLSRSFIQHGLTFGPEWEDE